MNKLTPAQSAAFTFKLAGRSANPDAVAARFLADAAEWRDIADKALSSPTGKFRGVTATEARELAHDLDSRSVSVPAELRKLLAA